MADEQQQSQAAETPAFDFQAWRAKQESAQDRAIKQPAAVEAKAEAKLAEPEAKAAEVESDDPEEHTPKLPRSVRRELNRLRSEVGEYKGRLAMMTELQAAGLTKTEAKAEVAKIESGEPTREQFQSDADYNKALIKFEAKKLHDESQAQATAKTREQEFFGSVAENTKKFEADVKTYPDWAEKMDAMDDIALDAVQQQALVALLGLSDQRAAVLYHFASNPAELKDFMAMPFDRQEKYFHRLEGRLEAGSVKAAEPEKKPKPTAAEIDAKKAKPSASVEAKGGQPTDGGVQMMMPDGTTINPAWLAQQNAKNGVRP